MSEHLSDLSIDEVVAGGPRSVHLESCAACLGRLERLRAHAEAVRTRPRFSGVRAELLAEQARLAGPKASRWRFGWMLVPALAAAMAAVVLWRPPDETMRPRPGEEAPPGVRLKGAPAVELLRLEDGAVNPVLSEGDHVALRLRGGRHPFALIVLVDVSGQAEQLWPTLGSASGELGDGQTAPLFQVTEGDFVVHAFYSDAPLEFGEVRRWLSMSSGPPPGTEHASVELKVESRR